MALEHIDYSGIDFTMIRGRMKELEELEELDNLTSVENVSLDDVEI